MIKSEHLICSAGTNTLPELWDRGRPGSAVCDTIYKIINVINNASRSRFFSDNTAAEPRARGLIFSLNVDDIFDSNISRSGLRI